MIRSPEQLGEVREAIGTKHKDTNTSNKMLPSSHSRSGGSRRTRTVDYQYETGDALTRQQSESHSRGRGILRNQRGDVRSDDSFSSSSLPRSRDSSVDSLPEPGDWAISDHKVPLTGGGEGSRSGRAPRRGSLNSSLEGSANFRFKMKSGGHNPFNNPFIDIPAPKKPQKPLKPQKTSRRKANRRSSLGEASSNNNDSFSNSQRSFNGSLRSLGAKFQRRGSMGDETTTLTGGDNDATTTPMNYRPKGKQARRSSMGDTPSSYSYQSQVQPTPQPLPQPQMQPLTQPVHTRMGRRNSLTHVSASSTPSNAKPKGILRRSSLDFGEASSDDGSMLYSVPPKMARRGSMNDVVTTIEQPSMPLKSAMKMSRRGSMNDVVSTIPSESSMPLKSSMRMSRRGSMNDVVTTIEPSMPLKSAMKMSRRGSMNDVVSTIPTSTSDSSMPLKSSMKMARRGSLNDTTTTPKATPSMEPSQNEAWQMPPRSILRRGSLSDVATEPSSSELPYRVVPTKMGRGAPLNDSPNTPQNDSSSMMSYRLSSMNSRKSNFSDGPKSSMKAPKTGSASYRSSRTTSLNDISGPPLSDGLMGMGGGYCVPLKSMSERNNRTIKGKEVDQSPLSTSERSISNSRRSFRSSRTSSTYYTDRSTLGSSQSGSISSIPIDVFDGYQDSIVSHLGGRGASIRANRSSYGYGSDDSSVNTFDTDDQSITQQLDEMESSTRSGGIISFEDSWSINNLAADQSQSDHNAATTLFPNRSQRTRSSIKIPQASLDDSNSTNETGNRDESIKLMRMEGDNWDDEGSEASFHLEDDVPGPTSGRRRSMQLSEVRSSKRISSLEFDGESLGLGQSAKSITWEDESLGASTGQLYGASYGASLSGAPRHSRHSRQSSLTWDEASLGLQSSKKSLTWEDDSLAPPNLARRSSLELEDGSEDDLNYIYGYEPAEPDIREDSDSSLGDFAESTLSRSPVRSKQDSDGSLGDFAATVSKQDSDGSLGDFAAASANQDSSGSLGDFAEATLSRSPARSKQDSDGSLGDFAAPVPSRSQRSSFSQFKQGSDRSLGDFAGSGSDSDDDSLSEESDGLIRDDEIFQDALSSMVQSTTPTAFKRNTSRRGSVGDYTLSLSGKGDVPDIDRSEKSITFGRRRSLSSVPQSALDGSIRSRDITTISEDSFEITAEELGIYNPGDGKDLYPQQLALMSEGDEDVGSFMSCSSEYDSSTFYDSDEEKEKRVKEGLMWGLGGIGVGALVGWLVKLFRKGSGEDEMDVMDLETLHDELGQSIAQSVLDESVNFTGSEQLWGWASLGDGGASAELVVSALHLPGTETAIISAATGAAAPTTSTAAGAAAVAATTNTMAVTAAGNVGAIAVTTTAVIGNSAIATGAGVGISSAVSGAGAAASGVMAALGLSGTGGSAAAVMGSAMGALAVAGTTYYSAAGHNMTAGDMLNFSAEGCPHLNPDNQTGVFRLTLDVSGMKGTEEDWGWMPFSDGVGDNSTSSDVLKEVWEELFASAYNNITNGGCSELFERRVLDANLTSSIHTGSSDGEAFLETEWEVSVACWEECPIEPIFGTELRRQLEPTGLQTFDANTTLDDANTILYTNTTLDTNSTLVDDRFFISELEFRSFFETQVHSAAGWEKTVNKIDFGNGNFIAIPNLVQDSDSGTSNDSPTMPPTESEAPTKSPTESPTTL